MDSNYKLALEFLAKKIGYNPENEYEMKLAMELYFIDDGILDQNLNVYKYICLMSESLTVNELKACIERNAPKDRKFLSIAENQWFNFNSKFPNLF